MRLFFYMCFTALLIIGASEAQNSAKLKCSLDKLVYLPAGYKVGPDDLEGLFDKGNYKRNPYFEWLTLKKDRAIFKRHRSQSFKIDLTMLGGEVPIDEAVLDFEEGKFLGITISVFNRGDGGSINQAEFQRRCDLIGKHFSEQLDTRPKKRVGNIKKGVMTSGYVWESRRGKAVLEYNVGAPGKIEFVRARLATKASKGIYAAAMKERSQATVRKSELARNVVEEDDNVYIKGIPMVDQGAKGYCVVASAQRLFEYYGIACDMHQLAVLAESDPKQGTSTLLINQQLGAIDYLFKTRFTCLAVSHNNGLYQLKDDKYVGKKVDEKKFHKLIRSNIDDGIPLLWSLMLGVAQEEPNLNPQTSGGHMRMIIGYNDETDRIIFTDSWGAGHEFKTIAAKDVYKVTRGIFLMKPTTN